MNLNRICIAGLLVALGVVACAIPAHAQRIDTTKVLTPPAPPTVHPDSLTRRAPTFSTARIAAPPAPPISTRRAFLYSLMLPGLGQSRLDRGAAGAFFAAIELGSLAMIQKTKADLREARKFSGDTLSDNFVIGSTDGKISKSGIFPPKFPTELISTRRLHVEDWFAALAFNHLISGADAFVAAQLWDVPRSIAVVPTSNGVALAVTLFW